MSYGIEFYGDDLSPVIASYGDNYYFYGKYVTPGYRYRPSNVYYYSDGYSITVPADEIPIIFAASQVGKKISMVGPHKVNPTTWYVAFMSGGRYVPGVELYVFLPRKSVQVEESYGLSTFDTGGNLVYTSDSLRVPLSVKAHRPEIDYFTDVPVRGTYKYYPSSDGGTFASIGIQKPAWYLPCAYIGTSSSGFTRLGIVLEADSTFSLCKMVVFPYTSGSTTEYGVSPIGVPFIDGAMYDNI
jgi:hypothetical protein